MSWRGRCDAVREGLTAQARPDVTLDPSPRSGSTLAGDLVAGALLAPLVTMALAAALAIPGWSPRVDDLRALVASSLSPAGWIGLPLLGGGVAALVSLMKAARGVRRLP